MTAGGSIGGWASTRPSVRGGPSDTLARMPVVVVARAVEALG